MPFFKWATFIEDSINKEFFKTVLKNSGAAKKKKKPANTSTPGTGTQKDNPYIQKDDDMDMFFESGLTFETPNKDDSLRRGSVSSV